MNPLVEAEDRRLDYRCDVCRNKFSDSADLRKRMERGYITKEEYDKESAIRKARQREAGAEALKNFREMRNSVMWDKAERSAKMSIRFLKALPEKTAPEMAWRLAMLELIKESLTRIKAERKQRMPEVKPLFWYDVDAMTAHKARVLVKEYPGEDCPIKVM